MSATKATENTIKMPPRTYGKIVLTLENSILPDIKLEATPSQNDGLDKENERDLRILGCELIQTAGILLKLPQVAMATGQVLFQRFFYSKSFVRHNMEATAMSCICLASKIEEAPRRIRDVINVFHHVKQVRAERPIVPMVLDQNYINLKSQVIKAERRVLKELGFCVHVKHPHKLIVMYLKYLELEAHQQMMQMAWNYMNDSFRTDVFVRYQPETIACACIYLTARKLNIPLPNNPPWFGIFKVTEEDITDVCYRIFALYKRTKPNAEKLEDAVDKLRQQYQEQRKKEKPGYNTPPMAVTTVDKKNGSHNAWGGFISRAIPITEVETKKSRTKSRSKSRSRSRSPHSPHYDKYDKHLKHHKKSRHRSRTPDKYAKKKSRHYSRSPSDESPSYNKHRKNDKKYDRRDKYREKNYERDDYYRSKDRGYNKDRDYSNGKTEKYRLSGNGDRRRSKHSRDRSRDRRR